MILVTLGKYNKIRSSYTGSVLLYSWKHRFSQVKGEKIYLVMHAVLDADIGEPERWKISTA